jgi:hypothetical protein
MFFPVHFRLMHLIWWSALYWNIGGLLARSCDSDAHPAGVTPVSGGTDGQAGDLKQRKVMVLKLMLKKSRTPWNRSRPLDMKQSAIAVHGAFVFTVEWRHGSQLMRIGTTML